MDKESSFSKNILNRVGHNKDIDPDKHLKTTLNRDIDPDKHLKTTLNSSGSVYYLESDFTRMISDNNCISYLSLLHINARSLCKNLNNMTS